MYHICLMMKSYDLSINNEEVLIWESSFTKAFNMTSIGLGFTIKYLKGLCYYLLEPINDSYIQTNINEIESKIKTKIIEN